MVNSTGACRLAATVWPASTLRRITVPSTGARITVRSRSTCACLSSDSRCLTAACALEICASLTLSCASTAFSCSRVLSSTVRALSSSAPEMKFLSTSAFLRSKSRCASARVTFTRPSSACAAAWFGARHRHRALRGVEVGARLVHAQLEGRRIDARDHLVLLHRGVEVGVDLLHLAGDLRADLHRGRRRSACRSPPPPRRSGRARPWRCDSAPRRRRRDCRTNTSRPRRAPRWRGR